MRKVFLIGFLVLFLFTLRAEDLISTLQEKGYSHYSYRCRFSSQSLAKKYTLKASGEVLFREGKGLVIKGTLDWGKGRKGEQVLLVNDKEFLLYNSLTRTAIRLDLIRLKQVLGDKFAYINPLGRYDLRNPFIMSGIVPGSIKFLKEEGEDYLFQMTIYPNPELGLPRKPYTGKLWVDKEKGLLKKMELLEEGKSVYSITYTDWKVNVDIPDKEFRFSPPPDTQVKDFTSQWLRKK